MVLELVAGRIIARFLGSSLYTWTSVIGVVLAGITIGNYSGGRLADRFKPVRILAILFAACAAACLVTIVANNLIGNWTWLWQFNWPTRILLHVTAVFLLPSTLLGTISPVVAKMALERGLPTGRTVGDIYAWGAAGSIVGTFAAGYYFIALMGTISIIWAVAAVMIVMALLYGAGLWTVRASAVILLGAVILAAGPWSWARQTALNIGLRETPKGITIYEDETSYCYVAVRTMGGSPEKRDFVQDKLVHSSILINEPNNLQYPYSQIMASITHRFSTGKDRPVFLVIGGGGYALPGYFERLWPHGTVDVVEIDPGVTKAAFAAFGLDPKTRINTISLDARNYIDELTEKRRQGLATRQYDFICEDAINDFSVPYQLTTKEFNDKLYELMTDDGIYMLNLIDAFDSGLFLGSLINTLEQTFPFVTVISQNNVTSWDRSTYVVVAAKRKLDLTDVCKGFDIEKIAWYLSNDEIAKLRDKSNGIVLTDDYAPVENMLAPVALRNVENRSDILVKQVQEYASQGNLRQAMRKLDTLARSDPAFSIGVFGVVAQIFIEQGKNNEAEQIFEMALDRFTDSQYSQQVLVLHYNYAAFLKKAGKDRQAAKQFDKAEQICNKILAEKPRESGIYSALGNIFAEKGDFTKAVENFRKALDLEPDNPENHTNLIQALDVGGNLDSAIQAAQKSVEYFQSRNRAQDAENIRQYLVQLQGQK
jgi:tetratricopeptide (TPR) repeat protein/MFS family permease